MAGRREFNLGRLTFSVQPEIAQLFRMYCYDRGLIFNDAIEDAIVDYLVRVNKISSTESVEMRKRLKISRT